MTDFNLNEAAICCDCILRLQPSSLRIAFSQLCEYLNATVWAILCKHFLQIKFLCDGDMEAISRASRLHSASQSQEMLLRLEKRKNMTIGMLLRHVRCAFDDSQFKCVVSLFSPLHTKRCAVYSLTAQYFDPISLQPTPATSANLNPFRQCNSLPAPVRQTQHQGHVHGNSYCPSIAHNGNVSSNFNSLQLESMNNLSDPFKPYLVITQHPKSVSLPGGDDIMLKCTAESDAPVKYSWKKNGKLLTGCTGKLLMIPDVRHDDSGVYLCVAKTDTLEVVSNSANVTIDDANASHVAIMQNFETPGFFATKKVALLIANEQYKYNPVLSSASNDVLAIARTLRELGFKTMTLVNLELDEMVTAVELFCKSLIDGAYCVTYLAGHGFENDGQSFIVPVNAPVNYTMEHCFSIKQMIENIQSARDLNLAVFLLDVCRKRLKRSDGSVRPMPSYKKSGNFVISYATMEHGMAYEVKGHELGVYASSLVNHLKKDKRVTRVVELVHSDIYRNSVTNGNQRPEFNSNMFEDRKLTDPLHSPCGQNEEILENKKWNLIHVGQKPNLYIFECGVDVVLHKTSPFSNQFLLEAAFESGNTPPLNVFNVCITLKGHSNAARQKILIENIQRLSNREVTIEIQLRSSDANVIDRYEDSIYIPFVDWWKQS